MTSIARGGGVTESERYLAKLAERTFLRLWSYPNTYFDKKQGGTGSGKELADLLVVCGDDIMVFSDKAVSWPGNDNLELSWSRWYRAAINKSVAQIRGAERWLSTYPDRVFLDPKCTQRFPIDMPPADRRRIHGLIIATGATEAVREIHNHESGTFIVCGHLKGNMHTSPDAKGYIPLTFGDVNPDGTFIHVFDPTALDMVMQELDTMSDFTDYLVKRAAFIRSGRFVLATGEEDLLAFYMQNIGDDGLHEFIPTDLNPALSEYGIKIVSGEYDAFVETAAYQRRRTANRPSYLWDKLIDVFVEHILAGTSVALLDQQPDSALAERGLRLMALENRVYRRLLGRSVQEALIKAREQRAERYVRSIWPGRYAHNRRTAYVFLILNFRDSLGTYEQYREMRAQMLQIYCYNLIEQVNEIDFVVGIGVDSAPDVSSHVGGSEDLVAIERPIWTDEFREMLNSARGQLGIRSLDEKNTINIEDTEYPEPDASRTSRQRRRARERGEKKARRSALNPRR